MKDTWFRFYIKHPIINRVQGLKAAILHKFTNYWYCNNCNKYHSDRVERFLYKESWVSSTGVHMSGYTGFTCDSTCQRMKREDSDK
jgi:hypothetical protein